MPQKLVPCPQVGHKQFQNSLKFIAIGDTETPQQISKFIRPQSCVQDDGLEIAYTPGDLQRIDLRMALSMFAYSGFIERTFAGNQHTFRHSECRIYQFQTIPRLGPAFIFGLFITDGESNLIDFCIDGKSVQRRRTVLLTLIKTICTPESVLKKLNH